MFLGRMMASQPSPIALVGTSTRSASVSTTISLPVGAQAGDICVLLILSSQLTSTTGWTTLAGQSWSHSNVNLYWKMLTVADITAGSFAITAVSSIVHAHMGVWRNGTGVTQVSQVLDPATMATSINLPSWTPNFYSLGNVLIGLASGLGPTAAPGGWTFVNRFVDGAVGQSSSICSYQNRNPGSSFGWSGFPSTTSDKVGIVLQIV